MGKASRNKRREKSSDIAVSTVSAPTEGRSWFLPVVIAILLVGGAGIGAVALQRESSVGIVPEFASGDGLRPIIGDHFHTAYGIYACDSFASPIENESGVGGIHTHGAGYIHVHPSSTSSTGQNANFGRFMANAGARLTGDSIRVDEIGVDLESGADCNGEPGVLQLAVWEDQFSLEDPEVLTGEAIAEYHLDRDGSALTLAFLPEGAEIPKPPSALFTYGG